MIRSYLFRGVCLAGVTLWATASYAAPVYIGLQEAGVNGGAITNESGAGGGNGASSISNVTYGNFFIQSVTAQGTPPLPEPNLNTATMDVTSPSLDPSGGTLKIYITELNQFPLTNGFISEFLLNALNQNVGSPSGAITSITMATYVTACPSGPCPAGNIFATGILLSTETLTSAGQDIKDVTGIPGGLTAPYSTTLVYTITATGGKYGEVSAGINLSTTPLPAAIWMMGSVLAGGAGVGRWRKRGKVA